MRYMLALPDGRILRPRISHPASKRETYGIALWRKILRVDLEVTEEQFWACVEDKIVPARGGPAPSPANALPIGLVNALVHQAGVPFEEVTRMSVAQAAQRLADLYSQSEQRPPP